MPLKTRAARVGSMDVNRMGPVELRVFALFAAAAAAGQSITIREVAGLAGPNGRTIGSRSAMSVAGDLVDSGLLALSPPLTVVGLDGPIEVSVAGRGPVEPTAKPVLPRPSSPLLPELREPTAPDAVPPPRGPRTTAEQPRGAKETRRPRDPKGPRDGGEQTGLRRFGVLTVPPGLPEPLLAELTAIVEGFRAHQAGGVADLTVVAELTKRKAAALTLWADAPYPLGTGLVRAEADRARRAYETTLQQLAQQRGIPWESARPDAAPGGHWAVSGLGEPVRGALTYIGRTAPGTAPVARLLALVCLLRGVGSGVANLTGPDLRGVCGKEAELAVGELTASGWLSVDVEELLATEEDPVGCGVPGATGFSLGKLPRTRSSGWVARLISHKKLRKQPAHVRLAALGITAHSDADGDARAEVAFLADLTATTAEEVAATTETLVADGWLTEADVKDGTVRGRIAPEHLIYVEALRTNTPVQTLQAAAKAAAAAQDAAATTAVSTP
ncbi:hypothetical protein ACIRL2_10240 [Embleya sp. NPDC127516]|uniref:hypothetical protein n=1 Tax=Embleya sp. NPDC127516 TaxID=3363990 RepID=UPI0038191AD2